MRGNALILPRGSCSCDRLLISALPSVPSVAFYHSISLSMAPIRNRLGAWLFVSVSWRGIPTPHDRRGVETFCSTLRRRLFSRRCNLCAALQTIHVSKESGSLRRSRSKDHLNVMTRTYHSHAPYTPFILVKVGVHRGSAGRHASLGTAVVLVAIPAGMMTSVRKSVSIHLPSDCFTLHQGPEAHASACSFGSVTTDQICELNTEV
jgi:hypothetical protein